MNNFSVTKADSSDVLGYRLRAVSERIVHVEGDAFVFGSDIQLLDAVMEVTYATMLSPLPQWWRVRAPDRALKYRLVFGAPGAIAITLSVPTQTEDAFVTARPVCSSLPLSWFDTNAVSAEVTSSSSVDYVRPTPYVAIPADNIASGSKEHSVGGLAGYITTGSLPMPIGSLGTAQGVWVEVTYEPGTGTFPGSTPFGIAFQYTKAGVTRYLIGTNFTSSYLGTLTNRASVAYIVGDDPGCTLTGISLWYASGEVDNNPTGIANYGYVRLDVYLVVKDKAVPVGTGNRDTPSGCGGGGLQGGSTSYLSPNGDYIV